MNLQVDSFSKSIRDSLKNIGFAFDKAEVFEKACFNHKELGLMITTTIEKDLSSEAMTIAKFSEKTHENFRNSEFFRFEMQNKDAKIKQLEFEHSEQRKEIERLKVFENYFEIQMKLSHGENK